MRVWLGVLGLIAALPAAAQGGAVPPLVKAELAPGVWQFTVPADGYVEQLNALVVVNDADVLVFDTFTRPSAAEMLVREIRAITPKPVRTIVNSHWHPDHWSGNGVIAHEWPGVEIIATAETAEFMRNIAPAWPAVFQGILGRNQATRAEEVRTGKHADGTPVTAEEGAQTDAELALIKGFVDEAVALVRVYPTRTYAGALTFKRGKREFRLTSMTGDAVGSTVLYLPRERILATGDLVVHPVTWTTQNYQIRPWRDNLRKLAEWDVAAIVPGHGAVQRDFAYVKLVADLFESVASQVRAALARGLVTPDEILPTIDVAAFRARFLAGHPDGAAQFDGTIRSLTTKTYQEMRDGMTSRR
jgi:cyclase